MDGFNKVILAGNLTRDPQMKFLPNKTAICEFGLALKRKARGQGGEKKEEVCFVDVTAFGKQAETLNQYLRKGRPVLVEGRLRYNQWEAQDGTKRSKLSVTLESFQFLSEGPARAAGAEQPSSGPADFAPPSTDDDDLPF